MTLDELEEVRHAQKRIKLIQESIKELDHLLLPSKVGGTHSTSPSSPVEQHFRQKEKLIERLENEQRSLLTQIDYVYTWMELVPNNIKNIVTSRFILGNSWKKTARMCYRVGTDETVPYHALKSYLEKNAEFADD